MHALAFTAEAPGALYGHMPSHTVTCPHAAKCPGCPLIALDYPDQLQEKHKRVSSTLAPFSELAASHIPEVAPADPITEYRSRAKLVVDRGSIGLFERGSHRVVDIPGCRVLDPAVARVAARLRQLP